MQSEITERFIECFERLKEQNKVRSGRQFAISLDYLPQSFGQIIKGNRDVTIELIRKSVEVYQFSPEYIFRGEGGFFCGEAKHEATRVLTIMTDRDDNERIVHVPVKAQAGYACEALEPEFFEELPHYSLPDYNYKVGTHRSFDVAGDSMEPSLFNGDKIICSYVEHFQWESSIRNNYVYVIVTTGDVLVKRVINNLRRHRHLELISDNSFYPTIRMNVNDIREVWVVRSRISTFSHMPPENSNGNNNIDRLHTIILEQSQQISNLNQRITEILEKSHPHS